MLVGGLHANVRANQCIAEIENLERLFVYPNMGDGGLAAGAAWMAWADAQAGDIAMPPRVQHVYLGSDISDDDAAAALRSVPRRSSGRRTWRGPWRSGLPPTRSSPAPRARWSSGRARWATARSCTARTTASVNNWLNKQLKRTEFMPFAPVVPRRRRRAVLRERDAGDAPTPRSS